MNEMPSTLCDPGLWKTQLQGVFFSPSLVETIVISGLTWWNISFYPLFLFSPTHEAITEYMQVKHDV